ncbi:MAG: UDP-3-O-acyl-N-acetylglucosamine deacetylase, partial [Pseudomonadota bacterium]
IDFDDKTIGRQRFMADLSPEVFERDIAPARTFGFMRDVEKLWAAGYALGSSFENSVVIGDEGVVNEDGLRFSDEFVRHKLLDAIGDLALSTAPLLGSYRSYRGGHKLNSLVLKALFADESAWSLVEYQPPVSAMGAAPAERSGEPAIALAPAKA